MIIYTILNSSLCILYVQEEEPFYVVIYYISRVTTSWTHSSLTPFLYRYVEVLVQLINCVVHYVAKLQ